jgi:hypothetical protein
MSNLVKEKSLLSLFQQYGPLSTDFAHVKFVGHNLKINNVTMFVIAYL